MLSPEGFRTQPGGVPRSARRGSRGQGGSFPKSFAGALPVVLGQGGIVRKIAERIQKGRYAPHEERKREKSMALISYLKVPNSREVHP